MDKALFATLFAATKEEMPGYQDRFVAFVTHLGFKGAYRGNVAARNARFMCWISERRAQFLKAHHELIHQTSLTGHLTTTDQDAFTNYIISGEWLE